MSGYLGGIIAGYLVNVVIAYAVFMPATAGIINLGAAGFVAIGAYISAYLSNEYGLSMAVTMPAAMLAGFVIGFVIALPILRTRGVYMVLATIAFGEIVTGILINVDAIGGAAGYPVNAYIGLPGIAIVTMLAVAFVFLLMTTRFGLTVRAIHDDEPVAALFGVHARLAKAIAFAIGGALAGLGGALYAHHYSYIDIGYFSTSLSIYTIIYVLIGGTQTALGPLLGAAVFSLLPEVFRGADQWRYVFFALLIIVLMAVRPEGLVTRSLLLRWRGTLSPMAAASDAEG
jgi:branched-chain amino acid transport system permease protein